MLPLDHPVRDSSVPYSRQSGTIVFPLDHLYLTAVHKDGLGLSQDPPTTVNTLQLWSCRLVQVTDYENNKSTSRWVVHVPYPENRVRSHMSSDRTLQHLSLLYTWEKLWRAPLIVMLGVTLADNIICRGLSPVGSLTNQKPSWCRYHNLSCMTNDPTFLVGRELMIHMSHRATYYSCTRTSVDCVASTLWLPVCWRRQFLTRMLEIKVEIGIGYLWVMLQWRLNVISCTDYIKWYV